MHSLTLSAALLVFFSTTYCIVLSPQIFNPIPTSKFDSNSVKYLFLTLKLTQETVYICNSSLFTPSVGGLSSFPGFNTIGCVNYYRLKVLKANYGVKRQSCAAFGANVTSTPCAESLRTLDIVKQMCNGKFECHISTALSGIRFPSFCPNDAGLALEVTYTCYMGAIRYHPFSNGNAPARGLSNKDFKAKQEKQKQNNNQNGQMNGNNRGAGTQVSMGTFAQSRFGRNMMA